MVAAAVDTNVVLQIYSCHDIEVAYGEVDQATLAMPETAHRRRRVRAAVLLTIYFDETSAITYTLASEPLAVLVANVQPNDATAFRTHFTTSFVRFVKDGLLSRWRIAEAVGGDGGVRGNVADQALLVFARHHGKTLITDEGNSPTGTVKKGSLRRRGEKQGVKVVTTEEFLTEHGADAAKLSNDFLARFQELAPAHIEKQPRPDVAEAVLRAMWGYYEHILLDTPSVEAHATDLPP